MARTVRIANFSGAMGDRFTALEEAVLGEPVDVVIGDFMAEITMSAIASGLTRSGRGAREFYARAFLAQVEPLLGDIAERGIKIVVNAGVFNPAGLAEALRAMIAERGVDLTVAHVEGDDLLDRTATLVAEGQLSHLDTGEAFDPAGPEIFAANAYLGGWGIAAALGTGADIVVTGRVADASLVLGPAAWWHGWGQEDWDRIAGAVVAAHIVECGPQAAGGNFSGFTTIPNNTLVAFPIAEVDEDGSCVITKRASDGGAVTVDTVTAQLMYEIQGPRYLNPDVVAHIDPVRLTQEGPDRVRVSGVQGGPPPETTKVGIHRLAGYRGATWVYPTGLDIDAKIDVLRRQAVAAAEGLNLTQVLVTPCGRPAEDPADQYAATVAVQIAASSEERGQVREFLAKCTSYGLGSIPGYYLDMTGASVGEVQRIEYWPGLVRQEDLRHEVVLADGRRIPVAVPKTAPFTGQPVSVAVEAAGEFGETRRVPFGEIVYARTGDKGGNANLGVWVPQPHAAAYPWLVGFLTEDRLRELLGLRESVAVERYPMPTIHGLSFVLRDFFGTSGSSYLGLDQIGKSLGEFLRAKHVDIPISLLDGA
ncbi:acyclic terpene utilization AtuA family protein [Nocardia kruczakiae]|nr:acyclic terpene utilization AtuA family protein [Nocardia kruczakiae]